MEELIQKIYEEIKDYRSDEEIHIFNPSGQIDIPQIENWISQFDLDYQLPILTELHKIFSNRYISKDNVRSFLRGLPATLTKDLKLASPQELLLSTQFLDLQPAGKSQGVMLNLFDEIIKEDYGISLSDCGAMVQNHSIYIDDILCTGNTFVNDLISWGEDSFDGAKSNAQAVIDGDTLLIVICVFFHKKNLYKKLKQLEHKFGRIFRNKLKVYRIAEIDNSTDYNNEIIMPLEEGQSKAVIDYKNAVLAEVLASKYPGEPEDFFRRVDKDFNSEIYTSIENRKIMEDAFLNKGIEILASVHARKSNIRALGYTVNHHKNFGFGALCFTWRNIPNNAPLVFWYSSPNFVPLFKVRRK